jgi:hypothetical protein
MGEWWTEEGCSLCSRIMIPSKLPTQTVVPIALFFRFGICLERFYWVKKVWPFLGVEELFCFVLCRPALLLFIFGGIDSEKTRRWHKQLSFCLRRSACITNSERARDSRTWMVIIGIGSVSSVMNMLLRVCMALIQTNMFRFWNEFATSKLFSGN